MTLQTAAEAGRVNHGLRQVAFNRRTPTNHLDCLPSKLTTYVLVLVLFSPASRGHSFEVYRILHTAIDVCSAHSTIGTSLLPIRSIPLIQGSHSSGDPTVQWQPGGQAASHISKRHFVSSHRATRFLAVYFLVYFPSLLLVPLFFFFEFSVGAIPRLACPHSPWSPESRSRRLRRSMQLCRNTRERGGRRPAARTTQSGKTGHTTNTANRLPTHQAAFPTSGTGATSGPKERPHWLTPRET